MLNNDEERFQLGHESFDNDPIIVVDFAAPIVDTETVSHAFVLKRLYPFSRLNQKGPSLTPVEEDGYNQRFGELELNLAY